MENEGEKYSRGASGFGAPDFASPAWRAGDSERQRLQQEKNNAFSTSSGTNSSTDNLNVWAFIITWLILFYLTYQVYVPLFEMIFGGDMRHKLSEPLKWLNLIIMMVPPSIIVFLFRRFIPALFVVGIIIGILLLAYFQLG